MSSTRRVARLKERRGVPLLLLLLFAHRHHTRMTQLALLLGAVEYVGQLVLVEVGTFIVRVGKSLDTLIAAVSCKRNVQTHPSACQLCAVSRALNATSRWAFCSARFGASILWLITHASGCRQFTRHSIELTHLSELLEDLWRQL